MGNSLKALVICLSLFLQLGCLNKKGSSKSPSASVASEEATVSNEISQSTSPTPTTTPSSSATPTDLIAPAAISGLSLSRLSSHTVQLTFIAPGDDGAGSGNVSGYQVADRTVATDSNSNIPENAWQNITATIVPPGSSQSLTIENISENATHHFLVRAIDDAGNVGTKSNVVSLAVGKKVSATLTFSSAPSLSSVVPAKLRYGKKVAMSYTLDDAYPDVMTHAYRLLQGGLAGDGQTYPGLFFTDGCGNDKNFTMATAWNSVNGSGTDLHATVGTFRWTDLDTVYLAGWDVLNHSHSHAYGAGTDYAFQISENVSWITSRTVSGIKVNQFVLPTGDAGYLPFVWSAGYRAAHSQSGTTNTLTGFDVTGSINFSNMHVTRSYTTNPTHTTSNVLDRLNTVYSNYNSNSKERWFTDFSHRVTSTGNGNIAWDVFKTYLQGMESSYGKSGDDSIWVAGPQSVYEYLYLRENLGIFKRLIGSQQVEISIDTLTVPSDFRLKAMSFTIPLGASLNQFSFQGTSSASACSRAGGHLLNLEWTQ